MSSDYEQYRVFVGGLSWEMNDRVLEDEFRRFGKVMEAKVGSQWFHFFFPAISFPVFFYFWYVSNWKDHPYSSLSLPLSLLLSPCLYLSVWCVCVSIWLCVSTYAPIRDVYATYTYTRVCICLKYARVAAREYVYVEIRVWCTCILCISICMYHMCFVDV